MEKNIWVISNDRIDMLEVQHSINVTGSMRAICILSYEALERLLLSCQAIPSLIIIDYEMSKYEEFKSLSLLKSKQILAGIPLFFMTDHSDEVIRNDCYMKGALAVLKKPFSKISVERIERMAWQFDVAKNTEKKLEQQAMDLKSAREIERLNKQLEARNHLLYQVFGRYFSDQVIKNIFENPNGVSIGGEKKDMTVMMADLRGFTSMSQGMDSDSMMDLLNYYFGRMIEIIRYYKGTVIEILGDGILAVFGAPIPTDEHTEFAIAAAIKMQNAMKIVNDYCCKKGYETLAMGIGIHRGTAFIGNIGSDKVMRYNVIGRVVNECSRIEGYSVGKQVLVSDTALKQIKCDYAVGEKIEIMAKGIENPIKVSEVIELSGEYQCRIEDEDEQELYTVSNKIIFELYLIIDKFVAEKPINVKLKRLSHKKAIVECEDESNMNLYADVKIIAKDECNNVLFSNVYAKLTKKTDDSISLHFTHINKDFQHFIKRLY